MAAELHGECQKPQVVLYFLHFLQWEVWLEQDILESNLVCCESVHGSRLTDTIYDLHLNENHFHRLIGCIQDYSVISQD